jgi:hypothetical protein
MVHPHVPVGGVANLSGPNSKRGDALLEARCGSAVKSADRAHFADLPGTRQRARHEKSPREGLS